MIRNFGEFSELAAVRMGSVREFFIKHGLFSKVHIDHICYKCALNEYQSLRNLLEEERVSVYSYQVRLSGRRVAYIKLKQSLPTSPLGADYVELSEAKPGKTEASGFHHVEIYLRKGAFEWDKDDKRLLELLTAGGEKPVLKVRLHHTTHDITLPGGFVVRISQGPLVKKIAEEILQPS